MEGFLCSDLNPETPAVSCSTHMVLILTSYIQVGRSTSNSDSFSCVSSCFKLLAFFGAE
jgi:hypothetical protein